MKELTQARVKELLDYNPETGVFTWRFSRGGAAVAGGKAGSLNQRGYVALTVDCRKWLAHRLAWLYVHGNCPDGIDHINGNCADNRIANLRPASQTFNLGNTRKHSNNTSGFKGVTFCRSTGRWMAQISKDRKHTKIGRFDTPEEAHKAYCAKALELYGEFAKYE